MNDDMGQVVAAEHPQTSGAVKMLIKLSGGGRVLSPRWNLLFVDRSVSQLAGQPDKRTGRETGAEKGNVAPATSLEELTPTD